jgi:hypothetical protein
MASLTHNALLRNLAQAEQRGQTERAARIRRRLARFGFKEPRAPQPVQEPVASPVEEPVVEEPTVEESAVEVQAVEEPAVEAPLFASPQADELARELGLGPHAFSFEPSGQGGYTVADVRRAAQE